MIIMNRKISMKKTDLIDKLYEEFEKDKETIKYQDK